MKMNAVCSRRWWREQVTSCDGHRLAISFWSCMAFIGLGMSLVVFGPTLLDIAHRLDVGVGLLSVIFLVRSIGGVIGTVGSGVLMDHFPRQQYSLLCLILAGGIAATVVVPLSVHIAMLGVMMFLMGVVLGGLDNGVHAILMRLWGDKSGPCMQFLHAAFAFGAFFAPLLAKPFIQDIPDSAEDLNTSLVFNVSCSDGNLTDFTFCDGRGSGSGCGTLLSVCIDAVTEACNTTASGVVDIYYDLYSNGSNCTVYSSLEEENYNSNFGWAYWISAMSLVPPLLAFIYFAVRYDIVKQKCTKKAQGENTLELTLAEDKDSQELVNHNRDCNTELDSETSPKDDRKVKLKTYKFPAFALLFFFTLFYVGSEVTYGSLVFTYAVYSKLQFGKQAAATLAAVFWGPFAFARLFSVILALLKVRASVMMTFNVTGSTIAISILLILPHNHVAVWITSGLLGASFASIFPTMMTWLSEHLPVSGKATAVVVAGGNLGDILVPSGVAALVGNVNPDSFVYCIFVLVILSAALIALLFTVTFVYQRRHTSQVKGVRYHKLGDSIDVSADPEDTSFDQQEQVSELEPDLQALT